MQNKTLLILILLLTLIFFHGCSTFISREKLVTQRIDTVLVSSLFTTANAGISVIELKSKQPIYQQNEKKLFRPASNQKLLTTAAACLFLGTDYNFETTLYHTGEIIDSVCNGDIFFVGGFDPEFTSENLDSMIYDLRKFGIKKINGNLYADVSSMDSLFWGEGWMWNDDPATYIPYLSPLTINKNAVKVIYEPGEVGMPANLKLFPNSDFFKIENGSVTDTGKTSFVIERDWLRRKNTIFAGGTISAAAKQDSASFNVVEPALYFLTLAKEGLERNQIELSGKIDTLTLPNNSTKIFAFRRNIVPVINRTNKISDNLNAELLLRALSKRISNEKASSRTGKRLIDSLITLIGAEPKTYRITDGSGLSYYNLAAAELFTKVLVYMFEQEAKTYDAFFKSLPICGVDGTLSNRCQNSSAKGNVFAKTGTLSGVASLSGYIKTRKDNWLAFSILIQNYVGSAAEARKIHDKICEILFEEL
ncbi:MAG: D-alanyl-D-alanine carboxypeptidase / D-alanyl-D-alanine-endopeptidase [Ignavibacteria bacterium]|nr:MAG: D-alanyl-D-alanine carboxypeptidase / D-alanyl-D-alanine-endopeptidase [Ignavibacteria bacterium]KAF0160816.1 MAG: D-alanyl-D-alanine carboxypeptidase / D-alanyl-D-alanine-endopeptidase [Ignavibacteria bacterium]